MIQETTNINLLTPISKKEFPNHLQFPLPSTLFPLILKVTQLGLMIWILPLVQRAPSAITLGTEGSTETLASH